MPNKNTSERDLAELLGCADLIHPRREAAEPLDFLHLTDAGEDMNPLAREPIATIYDRFAARFDRSHTSGELRALLNDIREVELQLKSVGR